MKNPTILINSRLDTVNEMNNSDSVADELKLRTYTVMAHANPGKNNRIFSAILAFANSINDSGEVNTIQMPALQTTGWKM